MALAVSLQHIALLTVELGDRAAMSAKAVTCCIRIFEVLEGTDILNADILDLKKLVNQSIAFLIIAEGETVSAVAVSPQPLNIVPNLYALQFLADIKRQTYALIPSHL